jgi:hypothetical protein
MLRENHGWKDVVVNWIIMILIICPLGAAAMIAFLWISFKILGAI